MSLLAQLSDIKTALGISASDSDTALTFHLAGACTLAEKLMGAREGQMRRTTGIVEFPEDAAVFSSRMLRLACRPVEFVSSVISLQSPGMDADFAAATPLVLNQDYIAASLGLGVLRRLDAGWYTRPRCNQVQYQAGWIDPATASSVSAWVTSHSYNVGDLVVQAGTIYACITAHTSGAGNIPTPGTSWGKSEAAVWAHVHQVPADLQMGIIQQTIRSFQTKDTGGIAPGSSIGVGGGGAGGGSMSLEATAHPVLVEACRAWRILL